MSLVVAISNHKGGVAKTTTCFSLGACLAKLGHRVLVVDLDPQADLTVSAGLDADALPVTVADLLAVEAGANAAAPPIYPTAAPMLDVLPADPRLANAERNLYDVASYETRLTQVLQPLGEKYSYILLDCPPSLGALTLMGLTAARQVLIPVQAEYFAARRVQNLLDIVAAVQQRTNASLKWSLLVTMFDQRNRICRGVVEQLKRSFPCYLLDTVIGVDTRLRESPAVGEPITVYSPHTRATRQYMNLAKELHKKLSRE